MAFQSGSKGRKKSIVLSKEYLDARRGQDLKAFQDQAVALQNEIAELQNKKALVLSDISAAEKAFEEWRETRLQDISKASVDLEAKKKQTLEEISDRLAEVDDKIAEAMSIHNITIQAGRRNEESAKEAERILSDAKKAKDEAGERWRKNQEIAAFNTELLNKVTIAEERSKKSVEDMESKRHELIQIQSRIDAALENLQDQNAARDEQIKQLTGLISENKEILARVDKFNQDVKAFTAKQAEFDIWQKDKDAIEKDLEARRVQADIRDKVQNQKAAELSQRENRVATLEKGAIT